MSSANDFGKDLGLMGEVVVTGRKAGMTRELWAELAHDTNLFEEIVGMVRNKCGKYPLGVSTARVGDMKNYVMHALLVDGIDAIFGKELVRLGHFYAKHEDFNGLVAKEIETVPSEEVTMEVLRGYFESQNARRMSMVEALCFVAKYHGLVPSDGEVIIPLSICYVGKMNCALYVEKKMWGRIDIQLLWDFTSHGKINSLKCKFFGIAK